jgi:hypothetical protein
MAIHEFYVLCEQEGSGPGSARIWLDRAMTSAAACTDLGGLPLTQPLTPGIHNELDFLVDIASGPSRVFLDAGDGYPQPVPAVDPDLSVVGATSKWFFTSGPPASNLGTVNDCALDIVSNKVYQKYVSGWLDTGANLAGAPGPAGASDWASISNKPAFGTAALANLATGVYDASHVATADLPQLNAAYLRLLGAMIGHGITDYYVMTQAAALADPNMTAGDCVVATDT